MSAIPIGRPNIDLRTRTKRKSKSQAASHFIGWAMVFGVVAIFVFGSSSLAGQVMVEKARRDGIRANQRLRAAMSAQTTLSRQIEVLSNDRDLVLWAKRNGFVAPELVPQSSGKSRVIVARR
jgi:hypothetical protein